LRLCSDLSSGASLRLRGDYLAIVTLGFGEIIRVILENCQKISPSLEFLGAPPVFPEITTGARLISHLSSVYGTALLVILLARNLKISSHGLAFLSIREDEVAAMQWVSIHPHQSHGICPERFFAGVGARCWPFALLPAQDLRVYPFDQLCRHDRSGRHGSITGATLAAVVLTALPEYLKTIQDRIHFKDEYRLVVYSCC